MAANKAVGAPPSRHNGPPPPHPQCTQTLAPRPSLRPRTDACARRAPLRSDTAAGAASADGPPAAFRALAWPAVALPAGAHRKLFAHPLRRAASAAEPWPSRRTQAGPPPGSTLPPGMMLVPCGPSPFVAGGTVYFASPPTACLPSSPPMGFFPFHSAPPRSEPSAQQQPPHSAPHTLPRRLSFRTASSGSSSPVPSPPTTTTTTPLLTEAQQLADALLVQIERGAQALQDNKRNSRQRHRNQEAAAANGCQVAFLDVYQLQARATCTAGAKSAQHSAPPAPPARNQRSAAQRRAHPARARAPRALEKGLHAPHSSVCSPAGRGTGAVRALLHVRFVHRPIVGGALYMTPQRQLTPPFRQIKQFALPFPQAIETLKSQMVFSPDMTSEQVRRRFSPPRPSAAPRLPLHSPPIDARVPGCPFAHHQLTRPRLPLR